MHIICWFIFLWNPINIVSRFSQRKIEYIKVTYRCVTRSDLVYIVDVLHFL